MKNNIGIALTLLGFVFSAYLFSLSISERSPVLSFTQPPIFIAGTDAKYQSEKFTLSKKGKKVEGSVWLSEFIFYNIGKIPLRKADITEQIFLKNINSDSQILNARIIEQSRPHVVKGLLVVNNNKVNLSYSILEKNDFLKGQIFYTGKKDSSFIVTGSIVGFKSIPTHETLQLNTFFKILLKNSGILTMLVIFLYFFMLFFSTTILPFFIKYFIKNFPKSLLSKQKKDYWLKILDKDTSYIKSEKISSEDIIIVLILSISIVIASYYQSKEHDFINNSRTNYLQESG